MQATPVLSDPEWELVVELLERERGELPVEIRHTDTSHVRDQLRQRLAMVQSLIGRLRDALTRGAATAATG